MTPFDQIKALENWVNTQILGQESLVQRMLIALLADGHLLLEGAPGLAKTSAIKILASGIEGDFHRIQFTPDLLPADLTGTEIFRPQDGAFAFQRGPIFHNFLLADEINRSPAKVQSALLEAMAERQVTVGRTTYPLEPMFLVMATQNPIEQAGTYALPEAQRDRFLLHTRVDYPDNATEQRIVRLVRAQRSGLVSGDKQPSPMSQESIFLARKAVLALYMSDELEAYLVRLVTATRDAGAFDPALASWIAYGASPRGSLSLDLAARAHAWLSGRDYVSPEDIIAVAHDCLRHRVLLTYSAQAEGITTDQVISRLLECLAIP